MKLNLLFAITIFSYISAKGQTNYIEGYVITNAGDTIKGKVVDHNFFKSKEVTIVDLSGKTSTFSLNDFKTLYAKQYDELYYVRTVDIDKKPIRLNELESTSDRKIQKETLLLQVLTKGTLDLYFYTDENSKKHFFISKTDSPEELGFVKFINKSNYKVEVPLYIQTLKDATADCNLVIIRKPSYDEGSLRPIVEKYNECFGEKAYVKKGEKSKLALGVIVGGRLSSMTFDGPDYSGGSNNGFFYTPGASSVKFDSKIGAIAGIELEVISPKKSNAFFPGIRLMWQQTGSIEGSTDLSPTDVIRHYSAKFSYVTLQLNFKYYVTKKRNPGLYLAAGIGVNYLIDYKGYVIRDDGTTVFPQEPFMDFRNLGLNYQGGVGISYRNLFIETRYMRDSMYGQSNATAGLQNYGLLLGYKFTTKME